MIMYTVKMIFIKCILFGGANWTRTPLLDLTWFNEVYQGYS